MIQFKVQTLNSNNGWDEKKRYKVDSVVTHNNILYQNVTGKNTEPGTDGNWFEIKNYFGFIPISGTIDGFPMSGDFEIKGTDYNISKIFQRDTINEFESSLNFDADGPFFGLKSENFDSSKLSQINLTNGVLTIQTLDDFVNIVSKESSLGGRGLSGSQDYTANIEDLDYVQKKYVGYRGEATLNLGSVTVLTDKVTPTSKIFVTVNHPSGTQGFINVPQTAIVDGVSFDINSSSALDNSDVYWWVVD